MASNTTTAPKASNPTVNATNANSAPKQNVPTSTDAPVDEDEDRSLPTGQVVDEIPPTDRNGVWVTESKWFFEHPHKIKMYEGVSQTTASYLRGKFGLDAQARRTRKVDNGKGGKSTVVDLYVRFIPEKQAEIKAAAKSKAGGKNKPAASSNANASSNPS